jgi:hypothetical protein
VPVNTTTGQAGCAALATGVHTVTAEFSGGVGFATSTSAPLTFGANPTPPPVGSDTTAPQTTISMRPHKKTRKRMARFAFASSEPGSSFECSLNGADFMECESPLRVRARRGRNSFAVAAIDSAGNTDASPAKYRWKVKRRR